jgi:4-diphosphocytidyl-2-C-methyl-D-erythritol kinase
LERRPAKANLDFVRLKAPAKINLTLRVLGKLKDGYHRIDSVMVPIALYDVIEIKKTGKRAEQIRVCCDQPEVPEGRENLVYRAAALILGQRGIAQSVAIRIRKRIPVGAGLGGGSSDAAAALLGLNRLFRFGLSAPKLAALGAKIGSDVPFFIYQKPARVGGRGEKVKRLARLPTLWLVVLYPGFPVATGWAYRNVRPKLTKLVRNTSIIASLRTRESLARILTNDLEAVTLPRYSELAVLKQKLLAEGALAALMSGSGSSVFGIFKSKVAARRAFRRLQKEEKTQAYLVHSLS